VWCQTLDSISQNLCTQTPHTHTQSHRNTIQTHDDTVCIVYTDVMHTCTIRIHTRIMHTYPLRTLLHTYTLCTYCTHTLSESVTCTHIMHAYTIRMCCNNQQPPESARSLNADTRYEHTHYPNSYTHHALIRSPHVMHTSTIRICNMHTRFAHIHHPNLLQQLVASKKSCF